VTSLPEPSFTGPSGCVADAINSTGQIAGAVFSGADEGFLYSNGTITNLGSFLPPAINDNGVLVGGPSIDSGGTVQNLNTLIPAGSGYEIQNATAINDSGQIVADAYDTATYQGHAVLLTPH
jgi:probable HAF family extracellular repeat protein